VPDGSSQTTRRIRTFAWVFIVCGLLLLLPAPITYSLGLGETDEARGVLLEIAFGLSLPLFLFGLALLFSGGIMVIACK